MIAWFFATALAKQWDQAIPYIEQRRLAPWTHNKTIQKSIKSYRITPEQKEYLQTLKINLAEISQLIGSFCIRSTANLLA